MTTILLGIGAVLLLIVGAFMLVRWLRSTESMTQDEFLERVRNLQ